MPKTKAEPIPNNGLMLWLVSEQPEPDEARQILLHIFARLGVQKVFGSVRVTKALRSAFALGQSYQGGQKEKSQNRESE